MIRDFSDDAKKILLNEIDNVTPKADEKVKDFFEDIAWSFKNLFNRKNLINSMNSIGDYHRYILDVKDTTKSEICSIFNKVYKIEEKYSYTLENICENLNSNLSLMLELKDVLYINDPAKIQIIKQKFNNHIDAVIYKIIAGVEVDITPELRKQLENELKNARNNRYNGGSDVSNLTDDQISRIVAIYETLYPKDAEDVNGIFATGDGHELSTEQINEIKYIVYTADEPYRSIYINYIDEFKINDIGGDGSFYSPSTNKVSFDDITESFEADKCGPYDTWFHECGHAIDANSTNGRSIVNDYYSIEYKTYSEDMGKEVTLQEAIFYDVYNNIEDNIDIYSSGYNVDKKKILESFKYGNDNISLTNNEMFVRNRVISSYLSGGKNDLSGPINSTASDIYGGVTNLIINAGYGHGPDKGETMEEFDYWYDSSGNETKKQSKELMAEYFADYITGDTKAIESMRKYLPTASKILDQMMLDMKEDMK